MHIRLKCIKKKLALVRTCFTFVLLVVATERMFFGRMVRAGFIIDVLSAVEEGCLLGVEYQLCLTMMQVSVMM